MSQEAEVNRSCDQRDVKSLTFFRRGGARLTTRVDAASGEPGHGLRIGEPIRGADAPGGGPMPAAGSRRAGRPDLVVPDGSGGAIAAPTLADRSIGC
jgi:hypothetical protein